eukprot:TRINITY_DN3854_c0_g1_i1.p1 TRINITY_DN3854_c0_g1~~TRINITY_DN3854_c0_g1_i1.p1  ORF type:complete len:161 (+),score=19.24 TRINITY_DN3854_c0_g1_i1:684-1166(+)
MELVSDLLPSEPEQQKGDIHATWASPRQVHSLGRLGTQPITARSSESMHASLSADPHTDRWCSLNLCASPSLHASAARSFTIASSSTPKSARCPHERLADLAEQERPHIGGRAGGGFKIKSASATIKSASVMIKSTRAMIKSTRAMIKSTSAMIKPRINL